MAHSAEALLRASKINQAIAFGADSVADIVEMASVPMWAVYSLADRFDIKLPRKKLPEETRVAMIRDALADPGVKSMDELYAKVGVSWSRLAVLCLEYGIKIPNRLTPAHIKPDLDYLIEGAASLNEMAELAGGSKQGNRLYIIGSGQYYQWRNSRARRRAEVREKASNLEEIATGIRGQSLRIATLLKAYVVKKAEQDGWAAKKAVEYAFSRRGHGGPRYQLQTLVALFERYDDAQKKGERPTLEKLGEGLGLLGPEVWWILKEVGVKSFRKTGERDRTKILNEAVVRGAEIGMGGTDIAYFLGLSRDYVYRMLREQRRAKPARAIKRFENVCLTYRLASTIYQLSDQGVGIAEIGSKLRTIQRVVDYALAHRSFLEKKIKVMLDVLEPDHPHDRPYRTAA